MRKSKLQAASLEGDADDIETAFYAALQNGDVDKLMACWADEDDIFCIHPGGPRVLGAVTPIGGVLLLAGWAVLAWACFAGTNSGPQP